MAFPAFPEEWGTVVHIDFRETFSSTFSGQRAHILDGFPPALAVRAPGAAIFYIIRRRRESMPFGALPF